MNCRWYSAWPATALVVLLTACAPLQSVELSPERALAPAEALLWTTLEEAKPGIWSREWYVLLNDGPQALDWRLKLIDAATRSVDLQTFLWHPDAAGSAITDHVLRAADRGVRIRLLIDDTFLVGEDENLLYLNHHPNIEYRIYNPYQRRSSDIATRQALNLGEFDRLDHRMHNKSMVVDGRIAIVGGRNLGDEYFGLHGEANFRDLELLFAGPVVAEVSQAFDAYWNGHWSFPVDRIAHVRAVPPDLQREKEVVGGESPVHAELDSAQRPAAWLSLFESAVPGQSRLLVDMPPDTDPAASGEAPVQVANELENLFDAAESEVVIVSAYLIPTPSLEGAVARAIERGVRVRILTNSIRSNNHLAAHAAYSNHVETLLGHGAELHEVRTDAEDRQLYMLDPVERKLLALHAKALIVDHDQVFIGSANLDPRSLRINTEMGLLVRSEALNELLRQSLQPDFDEGNAWRLLLDDMGRVVWVSGETQLTEQPAESFMQRIEDWFFSQLPIEEEL